MLVSRSRFLWVQLFGHVIRRFLIYLSFVFFPLFPSSGERNPNYLFEAIYIPTPDIDQVWFALAIHSMLYTPTIHVLS